MYSPLVYLLGIVMLLLLPLESKHKKLWDDENALYLPISREQQIKLDADSINMYKDWTTSNEGNEDVM